MRPCRPVLWAALFYSLWTCSLAGVRELRLPVPTSETIALVAREMGAATYEESLEEAEVDSEPAESGRRVQRKLVTGVEDLGDNMEYQEYQGVMGRPGVDFPVLPSIPSTSFSCRAVRKPGYFADLDTDCQVFHICDGGRKISFLCPNGTVFRQSHLICDWWFRVDCGKSVELYEESAEQLAADQRIYKERAEAIHRAMHKGADRDRDSRAFIPPPSRDNHRQEEESSNKPDTHIDAPLFAAARQNYENRQNARKQNALQQRRQPRPQTQSPVESNEQNQLQFKSTVGGNRANIEEKEQQVLSETASFASNRGNRFGKQFFQESYFTPGSPTQSNSFAPSNAVSQNTPTVNFVSQSPTTSSPQDIYFQSSSQTPSIPSESSYRTSPTSFSSSTVNSFRSSTVPTPVSPQRNFRSGARLLPTSSQNNNFRPSVPRNNFKNSRAPQQQQPVRISQQPVSSTPQSILVSPSVQPIPDSSQTNLVKASSQPPAVPSQNNFIRPSPDLIPPELKITPSNNNVPLQSSQNSGRIQGTAKITKNGISFSQGNSNNRIPSSTTKRPLLVSPANRFSSPTIEPPIDDSADQRRPKQRRFTSTTQKPVFTVKFRPSKSFSYIELERARTSSKSSTPLDSNLQVNTTTAQPKFSPSEVSSTNSLSTKEPLSSVSSVSYSTTGAENRQQQYSPVVVQDFENYETTDPPFTDSDPQTEWTPTRSPMLSTSSGFSLSSSSSSYSPTVPEQFSSKQSTSSSQQTSFISSNNEETRLDKLASFSNIDPAEINLLPSGRKPGSRPNLRIPESSGPNALHTLALYYATSESDSGTTPSYTAKDTIPPNTEGKLENLSRSHSKSSVQDSKSSTSSQSHRKPKSKVSDEILLRSHSGSPDSESEIDDVRTTVETSDAVKDISSVLTKATKDSYSFLFNETSGEHTHTEDKPCTGEDVYDLDATKESITENDSNLKIDIKNDLDSEQSRGIVQPTSTTKKPSYRLSAALDDLPDELKLKDSTDLRELAQVFSRALSAYLEDPDSFRRILSEVRPTEPTNTNTYGTTLALEENEDEVLDFSDVSNSGSRVTSGPSQKDSINSEDIELINDLAQTNSLNDTELFRDLSAPKEDAVNSVPQLFTTETPTSLANDINFLSQDTNHSGSESLIDDTYYPTAGGVDDQSRPRYGGFHNNSGSSEYKAYGSEVPESVTGRPITVTNYVTDGSEFDSTLDVSENFGIRNKNFSTSASNQIDIESIPDQLGIVPAQDINSLVEHHKDCDDPTHMHDNNFAGAPLPALQDENEEEIYGKEADQEKVLIASGSQSFVSRDNYVRFIGKQEYNSKSSANKAQTSKDIIKSTETLSTTPPTISVRGRGSVRYGPPTTADRSDLSNFRRRPQKELAFQNVNLGNGVTLERTKTIRTSTSAPTDYSQFESDSEEVDFDPISINEELGFVSEGVVVSTEQSFHRTTGNSVRATTYHPISSHKPELPDAIPPRGSLRDSWQWTSQASNDLEIKTRPEIVLTSPPNEQLGFSTEDLEQPQTNPFATFTSTLLPPNVTFETAEEEMLEKKAEEIFGKLNRTSADMLMNVMNQAESNMTVRRLVLLLVADRNGREKKSFEESRSQLIQALLKTSETTLPSEETTDEYSETKTTTKRTGRTRGRARSSTGTTTTSTQSSTTTTRGRGSKAYKGSETESPEKRPEAQYLRSPNLFPTGNNPGFGADPDARAVELLKSLYNLAARWG